MRSKRRSKEGIEASSQKKRLQGKGVSLTSNLVKILRFKRMSHNKTRIGYCEREKNSEITNMTANMKVTLEASKRKMLKMQRDVEREPRVQEVRGKYPQSKGRLEFTD